MADKFSFDFREPLPDSEISARASKLLGFQRRYDKVKNQIQLLLRSSDLEQWSRTEFGSVIPLVTFVKEQYPLVIFHGDVGTGKTAMAEAISNQLVRDARVEDAELFKLGSRVRGTGKVGEMGTLIAEAFAEIGKACGKHKRALLIIDEGDSLAASRNQEHSHHEDKVAVNTLIQAIDDTRQYGGRVVVFLCTNRIDILDPAIVRRAAVVEEFSRPDNDERRALFEQDLSGLEFTSTAIDALVKATGPTGEFPGWTYSDIRTRLYPAAVARAFPHERLKIVHFKDAIAGMKPSPVMGTR